jgi:hypothetical protein
MKKVESANFKIENNFCSHKDAKAQSWPKKNFKDLIF